MEKITSDDKRILIWFGCAVGIIIIIILFSVGTNKPESATQESAAWESEIGTLQNEVDALKNDISGLELRAEKLTKDYSDLAEEMKILQEENSVLEEKIETLTQLVEGIPAENDSRESSDGVGENEVDNSNGGDNEPPEYDNSNSTDNSEKSDDLAGSPPDNARSTAPSAADKTGGVEYSY